MNRILSLIVIFSLSIKTVGYTQNKNETTPSKNTKTIHSSSSTQVTPSTAKSTNVQPQSVTKTSHEKYQSSSNNSTDTEYKPFGPGYIEKGNKTKPKIETVEKVEMEKGSNEDGNSMGGIKKVGMEKPNYEDKNKRDSDNSMDESNLKTNSDSVKIVSESNINKTVSVNKTILYCDNFTGQVTSYKQSYLAKYEMFDLSELTKCKDAINAEEKWPVSCTEFERSSDERKAHIVSYPQFYKLDNLMNCESYKQFILDRKIETLKQP